MSDCRNERIICKLCPLPHKLGSGEFWLCADLSAANLHIEEHFFQIHGISEQVILIISNLNVSTVRSKKVRTKVFNLVPL